MKFKTSYDLRPEMLCNQRIIDAYVFAAEVERPPKLIAVRISQKAIKRPLVHLCRMLLRLNVLKPVDQDDAADMWHHSKAKRLGIQPTHPLIRRVAAVGISTILMPIE